MTKSSKISENFDSLGEIPTYTAGITQASGFRLVKKITDEALQPFTISTMQWFLLGLLHDAGEDGLSVTDISQKLGTNLPYVTNTSNILVERGFIVRTSHSKNGRSKVLTLAPEFKEQFPTIEAALRKALREKIYSRISPNELLTYIRVLYKFNELS